MNGLKVDQFFKIFFIEYIQLTNAGNVQDVVREKLEKVQRKQDFSTQKTRLYVNQCQLTKP